MQPMTSASMMCCDFFNIKEQLSELERGEIDLLHIDVMDGIFVPNIALGTDFVRALRKNTKIPLDIHLMTKNPEEKLEMFGITQGDYVSVHYEACPHLQKTLSAIRQRGAHPIVALSPATPCEFLHDVIDDIDGVLIMAVNPGFAGQKMIPQTISKIKRTRDFLSSLTEREIFIEVDGNVSIENGRKMREAGADIFVLGTSALFFGNISENIESFRKNVYGGR